MNKYHIYSEGVYHIVIANQYRIGQDGFLRLYRSSDTGGQIEPAAMFSKWESIVESESIPKS